MIPTTSNSRSKVSKCHSLSLIAHLMSTSLRHVSSSLFLTCHFYQFKVLHLKSIFEQNHMVFISNPQVTAYPITNLWGKKPSGFPLRCTPALTSFFPINCGPSNIESVKHSCIEASIMLNGQWNRIRTLQIHTFTCSCSTPSTESISKFNHELQLDPEIWLLE